MGVKTRAAEALQSAEESVQNAIHYLFIAANPETWNEFTDEYRLELLGIIDKLLKIQKQL